VRRKNSTGIDAALFASPLCGGVQKMEQEYNMKKTLLAALCAAAGVFAISSAHADGNFFVSGDVGRAMPDENDLASGNSYGVNGGYRWQVAPSLKLGVEGGYAVLGNFDTTGFYSGGTVKLKGWTLGANLHYNLTPNWYLSARAGGYFADLTGSSSYGSYSQHGNGGYGGVGFGYDFSSQTSIGMEYSRYDVAGGRANRLGVNGEVRF
jgi:OOP family OmpA-OmpF porin/outer membrane immunogenic protein